MPKRGPTPKDNPQRRNSPGARKMVAKQGAYPPLPNADNYSADTQHWYETLASSPQASQYHATDWLGLHMIAPLVDIYFTTDDTGLKLRVWTEMRHYLAKFGFTPEDRERLRWKIDDPEDDEQEKPAAPTSRDRKDPRAA